MRLHTSRDSWLKYAALGEARFELVVFYDGIVERLRGTQDQGEIMKKKKDETKRRANNAPPDIFREDYAHYS